MWSLTGRVPLWQELIDQYARHKPLAGHGYGAFWTPVHIDEVAASQGWSPAYAHSTYFDLLLSIGMIGMLMFVCLMISTLVRAAYLEGRYANCGFGFIAMLIGCILLDGTLETTFGNTSFTSFFCICGVCYALTSAAQSRQLSYNHVIV
jgi:exopolysaccharide production protein ExoQ